MMNRIIMIVVCIFTLSVLNAQVPPKDSKMNTQLESDKEKLLKLQEKEHAIAKEKEKEKEKEKKEHKKLVYATFRATVQDMSIVSWKKEETALKSDDKGVYMTLKEMNETFEDLDRSYNSISEFLNAIAALGYKLNTHSFAYSDKDNEIHYFTFSTVVKKAE